MLTFEPVSWRRSERFARLVLGRGSVLAQQVARDLGSFPSCWLLDPAAGRAVGDDAALAGLSAEREAEVCVGTFVGCLPWVRSVLVEDGPVMSEGQSVGHRAFIDAHVLRWADLSDGLLEASRLLCVDLDGSALCGYLSDRPLADLLIEPDLDLTAPQVTTIVHSISAVLVPLFDSDVMVAFCRDR